MATDWTTPMIILVGAGAALWAYNQGMFGQQAAAEEVYNQAGFEETGMSTICKCGSGRATHVGGDCASCKSYCSETCGNCTPQCIRGNEPPKPKSSVTKPTTSPFKPRSGTGTFRTSISGPTALKNKINAIANAPRHSGPITSTLCQCGSARATHVIGDCRTCRNRCKTICGL